MRHPVILGMVVLELLLLLRDRHLHVSTHVSDMVHNLPLPTLLLHSVPEVSVGQIESGQYRVRDARAYREFEVSHIAGATWVGHDDFDLAQLAGIATHAPVVVYSSVGYRSARIAVRLLRQEYTHVANIYGGIFQLASTGHPVVTGDETEPEQIHAYSKFRGTWLKRETPIHH
jgi:rhodanese-related sulfurtransferase